MNTMRSLHFGAAALSALTSSIANAQFPPKPEGLKVLESRFGDGVQISYKEVSHNSCVPFHSRPYLNGKHGHLDAQKLMAAPLCYNTQLNAC